MMKKKLLALAMIICLLCGAAGAETVSFSGTVEASESCPVYACIGGTAEDVPVRAGQTVAADTVIARIRTSKVYAPVDGTVTAVYGQPGENAEKVTSLYGAVLYLEGETVYTVSATSERAYDDKNNHIVHSGEEVFLVSRNHTTDTGKGIITAVTESGYTVRVLSGSFFIDDSVDIFRSPGAEATSRIGRGTVGRVAPEAVSGSGSIVSMLVEAGEQVRAGQLLFETVNGSFDGDEAVSTEIRAGIEGTLSTVSVQKGASVNENSVVAEIYPRGAVWVAISVSEMDLKEIAVGQKVLVELDWNEDDGVCYEGTVEMISALGTTQNDGTFYQAYVSFEPDEGTRYGMTALVTTVGEEADTAERNGSEEEASAREESAAASGAEEHGEETQSEGTGRQRNGERPSGDAAGGRPGRKKTDEAEAESGDVTEGEPTETEAPAQAGENAAADAPETETAAPAQAGENAAADDPETESAAPAQAGENAAADDPETETAEEASPAGDAVDTGTGETAPEA